MATGKALSGKPMSFVWLLTAALLGGALNATELAYTTPGYVFGVFDLTTPDNMNVVQPTPELAFPGATLEEIKNLTFGAWFCGSMINGTGNCESYFTKKYTNAAGVLEFLVVTPQKYDDVYVKGVAVKLTQGEDGVYAQALKRCWRKCDSKYLASTDFVNLASDGTITFNYSSGVPGNGYNGGTNGGYAICALNAMKWVPSSAPTRVFANPADSSPLTLEDIKDYRFTGVIAGGSVSPVKYTVVEAQNVHVEYDGSGNVSKIRLEMQLLDDRYLKCPVVELTNGEDGVYAQNVYSMYVTVTDGIGLGYHFYDANGNPVEGSRSASRSTSPAGNGYGVAGLSAFYANKVTYTLDASKTWSEMTGSSAVVDDESLNVVVNVTAENPVLTFDVPIAAQSITIASDANNAVTFAGAKPTFATWDLRGTSGNVTFNDFTPVEDTTTLNIVPNTSGTLVFNGSLNGVLPYNTTAVAVPCAEIVLGGTQSFASLALNKVKALTVAGVLTLDGALTGTGTVTFAPGGAFGVGGAASVASTVTLATPQDEYTSVVVAEGVNGATLVYDDASVTGKGLCLTAGTLSFDVTEEVRPAVGAGGTFAVNVDYALVHCGYTSPAHLEEGGVIRFYDPSGTEVGIGRAQMNVLPPLDAIWSPIEGGDSSFSTAAHWTGNAVPADGASVTVTSGTLAVAEVTIMQNQSYARVSIAAGSDLVFTPGQEGVRLSAGVLSVGLGARATVLLNAFSCEAVELSAGALLRLVGTQGEETLFAAPISGKGGIEVSGGTFAFDAQSSYRGGTKVCAGAVLKAVASHRATVDGEICGVFGMMDEQNIITVEAGGALDVNGAGDLNYFLVIAGQGLELDDGEFGGAVFNSGASHRTDWSQLYGLTLAADAMIRAENDIGFVSRSFNDPRRVNLGQHRLVKRGAGTLFFNTARGMTVSGEGTLRVEEGNVQWHAQVYNGALSALKANNVALETGEGGVFTTSGPATFNTISNSGTIELVTTSGDFNLDGTYSGDGIVNKRNGPGVNQSVRVGFNNTTKTEYHVYGGRIKVGSLVTGSKYAFNTEESPRAHQKVVVEEGGVFDVNGVADCVVHVVAAGLFDADSFQGVAFGNRSGTNVGNSKMQTFQLTLTADASVGGTAEFGLIAPSYNETRLELCGHTMRLFSATNFWMSNVDVIGPGKVLVSSGTLNFRRNPSRGDGWSLEVETGGRLDCGKEFSVSNLVVRGEVTGDQLVTAYGRYLPASETLPAVLLKGAAAGIDVSEFTEAWPLSDTLTFAPGTVVAAYTGERDIHNGMRLIAWSEPPAEVAKWKFECSKAKVRAYAASVHSDGLYIVSNGSVLFLR